MFTVTRIEWIESRNSETDRATTLFMIAEYLEGQWRVYEKETGDIRWYETPLTKAHLERIRREMREQETPRPKSIWHGMNYVAKASAGWPPAFSTWTGMSKMTTSGYAQRQRTAEAVYCFLVRRHRNCSGSDLTLPSVLLNKATRTWLKPHRWNAYRLFKGVLLGPCAIFHLCFASSRGPPKPASEDVFCVSRWANFYTGRYAQ